jgi:hypothetical protein
MKTYKVKIAWEGAKVGDEIKTIESPLTIAVALHLGFIEEVGAVKEKFVPMYDEEYWYITTPCEVLKTSNDGLSTDKMYIKIGNCYRTEAEALEARERVLKAY